MADAEDSLESAPAPGPAPPRVPRWERLAALTLTVLIALSFLAWVQRPSSVIDFLGVLPAELATGAVALWAAVPAGLGALHENARVLWGGRNACMCALLLGVVLLPPLSLLAALGKRCGLPRRVLWWLAAAHATMFPVAMALAGRYWTVAVRFSEPLRWHDGWLDQFTTEDSPIVRWMLLLSLAQFLLAAAVLWRTRKGARSKPSLAEEGGSENSPAL